MNVNKPGSAPVVDTAATFFESQRYTQAQAVYMTRAVMFTFGWAAYSAACLIGLAVIAAAAKQIAENPSSRSLATGVALGHTTFNHGGVVNKAYDAGSKGGSNIMSGSEPKMGNIQSAAEETSIGFDIDAVYLD